MRVKLLAIILVAALIIGIFAAQAVWKPGSRKGDEDGFVEVEGKVYIGQQVIANAQVSCSNTYKTTSDADGYYILKMPTGQRCHTNIPYEENHYQIAAYHVSYGVAYADVEAYDDQIVWQDIRFEQPNGDSDPADGIVRVFVRVLDVYTEERLDPNAWVRCGSIQARLVEDGWYKCEFGWDGHTNVFIYAGSSGYMDRSGLYGPISDTKKAYFEVNLFPTT